MGHDCAEVEVVLEDAGEQSGCAGFKMIVNRRLGTEITEEGEENPHAVASQALCLFQSQVTVLNAMRNVPIPTIIEIQYNGSNRYRSDYDDAL